MRPHCHDMWLQNVEPAISCRACTSFGSTEIHSVARPQFVLLSASEEDWDVYVDRGSKSAVKAFGDA